MNSGAYMNALDSFVRLSIPVAAPCLHFCRVVVMVRLGNPVRLSPTRDGTIPGSWLPPYRPGGSNNHDGAGPSTGTSLALQALYANEAVKQAFAQFN